jgi:hypothetical protein
MDEASRVVSLKQELINKVNGHQLNEALLISYP